MTPLTTSTQSSRQGDPGAEGSAALAERLGHTFGDLNLLRHALAHRSWCGEQEGGAPSNERLEFLGDAVLSLVVARYTYDRYPTFAEGQLAKIRSAVVNARMLADVAGRLGVGDVLLLGRGEEASGGAPRPPSWPTPSRPSSGRSTSTPAGTPPCSWCCASWASRSNGRARSPTTTTTRAGCKSAPCARARARPATWSTGSGPDHDRAYVAEVYLDGRSCGVGEGRSKKDAEQDAARQAWEALEDA